MESRRRGYVYECRKCHYSHIKAYAEWHFLKKHVPLEQQPYHCRPCRMPLQKKDFTTHMNTHTHEVNAAKHPADRPHIVTASNRQEDDTDLFVWSQSKSSERW